MKWRSDRTLEKDFIMEIIIEISSLGSGFVKLKGELKVLNR
jgi:hypothetical protein